MIDLNLITSIIKLNVNDINTTIKWQRLSYWIKLQDSVICYIQEMNFKYEGINRLNITGWEKIHNANSNQKKTGMAIPISEKVDFIVKNISVVKKIIL